MSIFGEPPYGTDPSWDDLKDRCTPSESQDAEAGVALSSDPAVDDKEGVYTVQLLLNKRRGFWSKDTRVVPLPGLFLDRDVADKVCAAAVEAVRALDPDIPVSASWCHHYALSDPDDPARSADGRQWYTRWAVFEAIMPRAGNATTGQE